MAPFDLIVIRISETHGFASQHHAQHQTTKGHVKQMGFQVLQPRGSAIQVLGGSAQHDGQQALGGSAAAQMQRVHRRRKPPLKKEQASPRRAAVTQLLRIAEEGAYSGLVSGNVGHSLDEDAASARGERQTTELVAGTTRWRRRLNYIIDQVSRQPHDKLEVPLLVVLQVAVYDITEGRLPDHAIGEYVDIIKAILRPAAGAYVNGVLRNLLRLRAAGSVPCPPPPGPGSLAAEVADRLAVAASHPTWMVERWLQRFPAEAVVALLAHNNKRPSYGIRCPPGQDPAAVREQLNSQGIDSQVSPYLPRHFIRVREGLQQVLKTNVLKAQSQVQDEAAGLVVLMLDPQPGDRILDACAAPGGKAMFAATLMQQQGFLLALDKSERRLKALQRMAVQQGVTDVVHCQAADLRHFASAQLGSQAAPAAPGTGDETAPVLFDRVLLDAPCSGLGVLAKRADLRWRRQTGDILELSQLQDELLDAAASVVRPGGLLVYSTCSIEPEENEGRATTFLSRHPQFSIEAPPPNTVPPALLNASQALEALPHVHGIDGAYAVRLRHTQ